MNTPIRTISSGPPTRRKPSEFLLPDGRKILVALPEDIEALRQRYANSHNANPPVQVEVVVHGSDEHRDYLHLARTHHETRRAQLRERLGPDVVNEIDSVRTDLDVVTAELQKLEAANGGNKLHTNFSRFGFDAKLRTYSDDDESSTPPSLSLTNTHTLGDTSSSSVVVQQGSYYDSMRLFRRPAIKQYFHRGLLWRAAQETQVMSFELFFDLLYVGIIHINGEHAADQVHGAGLLRFVITFTMSWKIWSDVQQLVSWFETNDILQRLQILFLIACLLGQTNNMIQVFSTSGDTFTQFVGFYLTARLFMAVYFAVATYYLPLVKGMMLCQIVNILVGAALWVAAATIDSSSVSGGDHSAVETAAAAAHMIAGRADTTEIETSGGSGSSQGTPSGRRLALIFVALAVDMFGNTVPVAIFRYGRSRTTPLAQRFNRFFEFVPAINIEHKVERTNAFVSLVLGYSVISVIYQNAGSFALNAFLGKAILGLIQAFAFSWLYFEVDGDNLAMHAIRRHPEWAILWQHIHIPFVMAYILAATALSKLVVAIDCPNTQLADLTEHYQHRSANVVSLGLRLYYCVGLGIALFSMGVISLSHEHKVPIGMCRLPKWLRLSNRGAICIVFFCLPAAGERLNSLHLVALTTCLTTWVLLLELWGKSCRSQPFFFGAGEGKCEYTARCGQRRLEGATKSDGEVDIVELGRGEKTAVTIP